jgi:hypothetical protein
VRARVCLCLIKRSIMATWESRLATFRVAHASVPNGRDLRPSMRLGFPWTRLGGPVPMESSRPPSAISNWSRGFVHSCLHRLSFDSDYREMVTVVRLFAGGVTLKEISQ